MSHIHFHLPISTVDFLVNLIRKTPLPHEISDPVVRELQRQANDPVIQSMQVTPATTTDTGQTTKSVEGNTAALSGAEPAEGPNYAASTQQPPLEQAK